MNIVVTQGHIHTKSNIFIINFDGLLEFVLIREITFNDLI